MTTIGDHQLIEISKRKGVLIPPEKTRVHMRGLYQFYEVLERFGSGDPTNYSDIIGWFKTNRGSLPTHPDGRKVWLDLCKTLGYEPKAYDKTPTNDPLKLQIEHWFCQHLAGDRKVLINGIVGLYMCEQAYNNSPEFKCAGSPAKDAFFGPTAAKLQQQFINWVNTKENYKLPSVCFLQSTFANGFEDITTPIYLCSGLRKTGRTRQLSLPFLKRGQPDGCGEDELVLPVAKKASNDADRIKDLEEGLAASEARERETMNKLKIVRADIIKILDRGLDETTLLNLLQKVSDVTESRSGEFTTPSDVVSMATETTVDCEAGSLSTLALNGPEDDVVSDDDDPPTTSLKHPQRVSTRKRPVSALEQSSDEDDDGGNCESVDDAGSNEDECNRDGVDTTQNCSNPRKSKEESLMLLEKVMVAFQGVEVIDRIRFPSGGSPMEKAARKAALRVLGIDKLPYGTTFTKCTLGEDGWLAGIGVPWAKRSIFASIVARIAMLTSERLHTPCGLHGAVKEMRVAFREGAACRKAQIWVWTGTALATRAAICSQMTAKEIYEMRVCKGCGKVKTTHCGCSTALTAHSPSMACDAPIHSKIFYDEATIDVSDEAEPPASIETTESPKPTSSTRKLPIYTLDDSSDEDDIDSTGISLQGCIAGSSRLIDAQNTDSTKDDASYSEEDSKEGVDVGDEAGSSDDGQLSTIDIPSDPPQWKTTMLDMIARGCMPQTTVEDDNVPKSVCKAIKESGEWSALVASTPETFMALGVSDPRNRSQAARLIFHLFMLVGDTSTRVWQKYLAVRKGGPKYWWFILNGSQWKNLAMKANSASLQLPSPVVPTLLPVPAPVALKGATVGGKQRDAPRNDRCPGVRNTRCRVVWSKEEDAAILDGVERYGQKWRIVASAIPHRSDDSVRNRWNRLVNDEADVVGTLSDAANVAVSTVDEQANGGELSTECALGAKQTDTPSANVKDRHAWSREEDDIIVRSVKVSQTDPNMRLNSKHN